MWILRVFGLLALAAYWFLLGGITQMNVFYVWCAVSAAVAIIGVVVLLTAGRGLVLTRELPAEATEGDTINVRLRLRNTSWWPKTLLHIVDQFPAEPPDAASHHALIDYVGPGQSVTWRYTACCQQRGRYTIGPCEVTMHDPVALFTAHQRFPGRQELIVYPRIFPIRQFPALESGRTPRFGLAVGRLGGGDAGDFYGIREYRRGDSLQQIHWRSSARIGKLVVKQFEKSTIGEVTLVLDALRGHDLGTEQETTLEYAVTMLASLATYLVNQQVLVQFICYGRQNVSLPFGRGHEHLHRLLRALAEVRADGTASLGTVLRTAEPTIPQGSLCVVCLLNTDLEAIGSLWQLRFKGITPIVFVLDVATFAPDAQLSGMHLVAPEEIHQILASADARAFRIRRGEDLERQFARHVR